MIKIKETKDLEQIREPQVLDYAGRLLRRLLQTFETENIEPYGAIFYIEEEKDLLEYQSFCLSAPLTPDRFEWLTDIGSGYLSGCIVINNSKAVSLVGKAEYFKKYKED